MIGISGINLFGNQYVTYPGANLINSPAPVGYGITNAPVDLWAWAGLGNQGWTSNFGGATQYNTYTGGYDPMAYYLAHNMWLMQVDPMLTSLNPSYDQPPIYVRVYADSFAKTITGLEENLKRNIENENLTPDQKAKLQAKLDELQDLKERIREAVDSCQSSTKLKELKAELDELAASISETAHNIADEVSQSAQNDPEETSASEVSEQEDVEAQISPEMKKEATEICKNIYDGAMGSVGTNYSKIKNGINNISKENVTSVLKIWADQYQPLSGDDNIVETIFDEELLWNNKTNTGLIAVIFKRLEERAEQIGIIDKLAGYFSVAYDELDDTFVNEGKVKQAFEAIFKAVSTAEAGYIAKIQKAEEEAEAKKLEDAKKEEEAIRKAQQDEQAQELFLSDLRAFFKDDKTEISDKIKYEDGKFIVRIDGRDFSGKDFNELRKNIKKAGYDNPENYLKKQQLQTVA